MAVQRTTDLIFGMRVTLAILVCFLSVPPSARGSGQCSAPYYREGQVWENSESSVFMAVSIPLSDFAPARLVCLAGAFRQQFHGRKSISILIFSSRDAAERYMPNPPDYAPAEGEKQQRLQSLTFWRSQLHGFYSYDAEKGEEHLDIRPFGSDVGGGPYDTRIILPTAQHVVCRLEMSGRCMLALEPISYSDAALRDRVSGDVTLTGSIARSGEIVGIQVAEARIEPSNKKELLVNEAIRSLKSWRFESASRKDPIRITYSYLTDPSLPVPAPYRKQVDVQLNLPNHVTIRGNQH